MRCSVPEHMLLCFYFGMGGFFWGLLGHNLLVAFGLLLGIVVLHEGGLQTEPATQVTTTHPAMLFLFLFVVLVTKVPPLSVWPAACQRVCINSGPKKKNDNISEALFGVTAPLFIACEFLLSAV